MNGATLSKSARWTRFCADLAGDASAPIGSSSRITRCNNYRILVDYTNAYGGGVKIYSSGAWGGLGHVYDLQFRIAGTMETTEQISLMAANSAGGQFLSGVRIDQASGIFNNPKRNGDTTALEEIRAHLAAGTAAGGGLQATITAERMLIVGAKPAASSAGLLVRSDGIIRLAERANSAARARPGRVPGQ